MPWAFTGRPVGAGKAWFVARPLPVGTRKAWFVAWPLPFGLEVRHTDGTFSKFTRRAMTQAPTGRHVKAQGIALGMFRKIMTKPCRGEIPRPAFRFTDHQPRYPAGGGRFFWGGLYRFSCGLPSPLLVPCPFLSRVFRRSQNPSTSSSVSVSAFFLFLSTNWSS